MTLQLAGTEGWALTLDFARSDEAITRVVVAEDEAEMRYLLELDLRRNGVEVITVPDGRRLVQCIERLAAADRLPDAIISDVRMPVMDGLTAIERLRPLAPEVPVVVISGFTSRSTRDAAHRLGARTLDKPFDFDDLINLLAELRPARRRAPGQGASRETA